MVGPLVVAGCEDCAIFASNVKHPEGIALICKGSAHNNAIVNV